MRARIRLAIAAGCTAAALFVGASRTAKAEDPESAVARSAAAGVAFRVNAGGGDHRDTNGDLFVADRAYAPGGFGYVGGTSLALGLAIEGTSDDALYATLRAGPRIRYRFDGLPDGRYEIRLYWTEPVATRPGERKIDVRIDGRLVRAGFDVFFYSGSPDSRNVVGAGTRKAYRETFVTKVKRGRLLVELTVAKGDAALLSAIAVVPERPAPLGGFADVAALVGVLGANQPNPGECLPPLGTGSAWADFDADGAVDLYVTNHGGPNRLYRNLGDPGGAGVPVFADVAAQVGVDDPDGISHAAVFVDYDNDGDQDLYVTDLGGNKLFQSQLVERGAPAFRDVTQAAGLADDGRAITAAWGDFDADGFLDLYLVKHYTCVPDERVSQDRLYRNLGDGRFADVTDWLCGAAGPACAPTAGPGFAAAWVDYDSDGDADLYVANEDIDQANSANALWRNDGPDAAGGWRFRDVSADSGANSGVNAMGLGVGDYDNDGHLDFAFSNIAPNNLLRNRGDGHFEDVSAAAGIQRAYLGPPYATDVGEQWTWGTAFLDHDNDGWLDLLYVAGTLFDDRPLIPNAFFVNERDGSFSDRSATSGLGAPMRARAAAVADFDADGFPDVFVSNVPDTSNPNAGPGAHPSGGTPHLFWNVSRMLGNTSRWLRVTVEGRVSNRDGIGTRLVLTRPDGLRLTREIGSGATHGGGDERVALFGLGAHASGELEIRWPSGRVENLGPVAAGQTLHLVEPAD